MMENATMNNHCLFVSVMSNETSLFELDLKPHDVRCFIDINKWRYQTFKSLIVCEFYFFFFVAYYIRHISVSLVQ